MATTNLGAVGFKPKGQYSSTATYTRLDVVSYLGGSFLCIIKNGETITNKAPEKGNTTTYWQCLAIPGDVTDEYTRIYNEVISISNQVTADKNAVNSLRTEVINTIEEYGTVQVTDTEPSSENVDIWIDDSQNEEYTLPEVKDEQVNKSDTWSSQKINDEIQILRSLIATDTEASEYLGI